ncbi:MAG TPA: hypothetical protein VGJ02_06430 [Pyrinomonadaceae bacterium]
MFRFFVLTGLLVFAGFAMTAAAQDTNQRTRDLVASLDKTKYKKKEKVNVSVEVYLDIKNTPAAKANPADYSGLYDADGFRLRLEVASDGSAMGSGFDTLVDSGKTLNFELKNARIDGALLTAAKVYDGGREESFEAAFVHRTSRTGKNPNDVATTDTKFGLGFIQSAQGNETWTNRVFLEKR